MKKFLAAAAVLTALGGFGGSGWAADPSIDPGFDWTGLYVGVVAGYGFGETTWEERSVSAESDSGDFDGFTGGATLGFNVQTSSNLVVGAELDGLWSDINGTSTSSGTFGCGALGCDVDVNWFGTGRLRAGMAIGNTLPYLTGGVAVGEAEAIAPSVPTTQSDDTLVGWTVGAGLEHAFNQNLSVKAEVLYVDLGKLEIPTSCSTQCFTDVDFTTARVGLNWHF